MSEGAFPFSFADLTKPGNDGAELRDMIVRAAGAGVIAPGALRSLAEMMVAQGQPGLALWALTTLVSLPGAEVAGTGGLILAASASTEPPDAPVSLESARKRLLLACDGLGDEGFSGWMAELVEAMAKAPETAGALVEGTATTEAARVLTLAGSLFNADLDGARKADVALAALAPLRRFTHVVRIKLALTEGDYDRAVALCRTAIDAVGADAQLTVLMTEAEFCRGNHAQGHAWAARLGDFFPPEYLAVRRNQIREWHAQFERALERDLVDGGADGRIGSFERYRAPANVADYYADHRANCTPANAFRTLAGWTNRVMFGAVEEFLAADMGITTVINFGTLCGVLEDELSARYPDIHWVGYDYSPLATAMNRESYARDNLSFHDDLDSMFAALAERSGEMLMVHCRSTDVMFPAAVKQVYRRCHAAGVRYLFTAEYFCRNLMTFEFPDFEKNPADSAYWDGILMVHNYARLFAATGYRQVSAAIRPVPLLVSASGEGRAVDQMIETVLGERVPD